MASVRANPTLRNDFEDSVDILCQAVRSYHRTNLSTRRFSSFNRNTTSRGKLKFHRHPRRGGNNQGGNHRNNQSKNHQNNDTTIVYDRFYTSKEYGTLS